VQRYYVLSEDLAETVTGLNTASDTFNEYRLQPVYGWENWIKIQSLGLSRYPWQDKKVLDVCCGTGFLSYHLLSRVTPRSLFLNDISGNELSRAKVLIGQIIYKRSIDCNINYFQADILSSNLRDESFDIIIGNSFLHHFYNIPKALKGFYHLLKPGGLFITLHEPTVAAIALESGNIRFLLKYLIKGEKYVEKRRFRGDGIAPGGGADVWCFQKSDIIKLAKDAGFVKVIAKDWNLFRPLMVALFALHLNSQKRELESHEIMILKTSIMMDSILCRVLPSFLFGSFCLLAQKANK
jgi:SAM-dependent methyltransferase